MLYIHVFAASLSVLDHCQVEVIADRGEVMIAPLGSSRTRETRQIRWQQYMPVMPHRRPQDMRGVAAKCEYPITLSLKLEIELWEMFSAFLAANGLAPHGRLNLLLALLFSSLSFTIHVLSAYHYLYTNHTVHILSPSCTVLYKPLIVVQSSIGKIIESRSHK